MSLKPKGIQNLNNTCFANSVLQALLSVKNVHRNVITVVSRISKWSQIISVVTVQIFWEHFLLRHG